MKQASGNMGYSYYRLLATILVVFFYFLGIYFFLFLYSQGKYAYGVSICHGRRGDHSPRLRFRTGRATLTAPGSSVRPSLSWILVEGISQLENCSLGATPLTRLLLLPHGPGRVRRRFRIWAPTGSVSFCLTVPTSAYSGHCPRPLLLGESFS